MGKATKVKMGYGEAVGLLPRLDSELAQAARAYEDTLAVVRKAMAALNQHGASVTRLRARLRNLQAIVDAGPSGETPVVRMAMPNPERADELVAEALEAGTAPASSSVVYSTEPNAAPEVPGLIDADVNLRTRIGGLWRVKQRSEPQTLAAGHFRFLWDISQIGGSKATDYTAVRVDTSGPVSADAVVVDGEDARRRFAKARDLIETAYGAEAVALCECVICYDMSLGAMARQLKRPAEGKGLAPTIRELLQSLDVLAELWGFDASRKRSRLRRSGDKVEWVAGRPVMHASGVKVKEPA